MISHYDKSPEKGEIPRDFIFRRLHSLAGIFFLLFLCEHLFTNSQATLFIGDDGRDFIHSVNFIHSLPYLPLLEIIFVALPLFIHAWWGVYRMRTCRLNSFVTDGSSPDLSTFPRNNAFTWQRITSVLLIIGIALHVFYMRFDKSPIENKGKYSVEVSSDNGLPSVAARLDIAIEQNGQTVTASAKSIGAAFLLVLRDTYKSISMCLIYSLFVLLAIFHGCNGLWTFAITWGICLSERARAFTRCFSNALLVLLGFLGFVCIWGVYWVNLRY